MELNPTPLFLAIEQKAHVILILSRTHCLVQPRFGHKVIDFFSHGLWFLCVSRTTDSLIPVGVFRSVAGEQFNRPSHCELLISSYTFPLAESVVVH